MNLSLKVICILNTESVTYIFCLAISATEPIPEYKYIFHCSHHVKDFYNTSWSNQISHYYESKLVILSKYSKLQKSDFYRVLKRATFVNDYLIRNRNSFKQHF